MFKTPQFYRRREFERPMMRCRKIEKAKIHSQEFSYMLSIHACICQSTTECDSAEMEDVSRRSVKHGKFFPPKLFFSARLAPFEKAKKATTQL